MGKDIKQIRAIESLDEMTCILKNELQNIAEGYIAVGYYLKKTRDDELYKQKGYADVYEFAKSVFGISRTWALRFMQVNDRYSIGGYSPEIQEKYRGYGSSKLTEMLDLPEEIRDEVPRSATVKDIRSVKNTIKETERKYDPQMELCDVAQNEKSDEPRMQRLARHFFRHDGRDAFEQMVEWERADIGNDERGIIEDILAIVNPSKFKMVRLETANVLMTENGIQVMPYRNQGEKEDYTYIDLARAFEELFYPNYPDISRPINEIYRAVYGVPYYEEAKHEEKPKKQEKKTEKKPAGNTKPVPKHEPTPVSKVETPGEVAQTLGNPRVPEDPEKRKPEKIEKKEPENSEQIPGQTEITKDFPEYCPENMVNDAKAPESEMSGHLRNARLSDAYTSRRRYLANLPEEEAGAYMAAVMEEKMKRMKNVGFRVLAQAEFWETFLNAEVDEGGREIECVS